MADAAYGFMVPPAREALRRDRDEVRRAKSGKVQGKVARMPSLADLGWTDRLAAAFAPHGAAGLIAARVSLEHTHIYRVLTEAGEWLARVSGRLRHEAAARAEFPAVGDWVAVDPPRDDGMARVRVVLPRASRFSRRAAGDRTEEQVVAANIDIVFLVVGLDGDFNPRRIERYLLVASDSGATPVVVLNKVDLVSDPGPYLADVRALSPGVAVHAVSCNDPASLAVLRAHLGPGRTGALLGSSGVGKSTIVNRLVGFDLLATRDVRISDSRGRHTSTSRQLVILPEDGILIDTPGMRELQLWETGEAATETFADVAELAGGCRFRDCVHESEPGCAVVSAVAAGQLPAFRLESFRKLRQEQAHQHRQQDARAQLDDKRRSKALTRALDKRIKDKDR
jgi:ribosome biogenesis GTPase / thiamine phosphate phosphatase